MDSATLCQATGYRKIELYAELGSSNDRALEWVRESAPATPAAVIAERQTAGRGQPGRSWISTDESLTFSCILKSDDVTIAADTPCPRTLLPLLVAERIVAAAEHLQPQLDSRLAIKWPNDILIDRRKVAGILIESTHAFLPTHAAASRPIEYLIIGIGLNLNQETADSLLTPAAGQFPPTSVRMATKTCLDRESWLLALLCAIGHLNEGQSPAERIAAVEKKLFGRSSKIRIALPNNTILSGDLIGIDPAGRLILGTEIGEQSVHSGTILNPERA